MLIDLLTIVMLYSFVACNISQIIRMMKTKSSNDISLWFVGLILVGVTSSYIIMLLTKASLSLIVPQATNLILSFVVFCVVLFYRFRKVNL